MMEFENLGSVIKFIGTGGFFDDLNGNSAVVVKRNEGNLLIDCGYTVFSFLKQKSMIDKIDYLLLTHLHGDHAGSLHPLILYCKNIRQKKLTILYTTEDYRKQLETYMDIFLVRSTDYVDFVKIDTIPGIGYIDTMDKHTIGIQSFAYYFEFSDFYVYYSGDLGDTQVTLDFINTHTDKEVYLLHEVNFMQGSAHVYYKDFMESFAAFKVLAYHCDHRKAPADCRIRFVADIPELNI